VSAGALGKAAVLGAPYIGLVNWSVFEDAGTLHAVAVYPDQVPVQRTQVEQRNQRDGMLLVISGRRRAFV
jgi:hypothetical protein